jgi:hypothetical protein
MYQFIQNTRKEERQARNHSRLYVGELSPRRYAGVANRVSRTRSLAADQVAITDTEGEPMSDASTIEERCAGVVEQRFDEAAEFCSLP